LSALIDAYSQQEAWHIHFSTSGTNRPLPGRLEMGLYRIVQEALHNCAQHAQAGQVTIELAIIPRQVQLIIEDNGQGFEPTQIATGHFGLIGLNERARLLGGTLKIESSPGEGTRVEVVVPLE
jgi:signal transduction histidine kinase